MPATPSNAVARNGTTLPLPDFVIPPLDCLGGGAASFRSPLGAWIKCKGFLGRQSADHPRGTDRIPKTGSKCMSPTVFGTGNAAAQCLTPGRDVVITASYRDGVWKGPVPAPENGPNLTNTPPAACSRDAGGDEYDKDPSCPPPPMPPVRTMLSSRLS
jgi:hypothetical protein